MFKVGDKVRIISGSDNVQLKYIGRIDTIISIGHSDRIYITTEDDGDVYFKAEMLELITKPIRSTHMKIVNSKKTLTLTIPHNCRTKAQELIVKNLVKAGDPTKVTQYLNTFKATRNHKVELKRIKTEGNDLLQMVRKGRLTDKQHEMYNLNGEHTPIQAIDNWIGVEIECCIPYESLDLESSDGECNRCEGSGNVPDDEATYECEICEGRGTITKTDSEGIESENECDSCEGRGSHPDEDATCECSRCEGSGRDSDDEGESDGHRALSRYFKQHKVFFTSIKHDGSITPKAGEFAVEIVVLTRISNPKNLAKVCSLLKGLHATVNSSCGMHIHLDARRLVEEQVMEVGAKFRHALPTMARLVPKTRRTNNFCQLKVSPLIGDRYAAVNLTAYEKHKTIEVRLHSSTTDFNKIINWAKLITLIKDSKLKSKVDNLQELSDRIRMPQELLEYFTQREALFNGTKSSDVSIAAQDTDSSDREVA